MKQSQLYIKTRKEAPSGEEAKNAILLTRAGFIHKEMAGVYTFLPLGLRTLSKIENIIRKHMDTIGVELLMTSLAPKEMWENTGRLEVVDVLMKTSGANEASKQKSTNEYILNSTHEEMITPIAKEHLHSYRDLPAAYYQIQTKFRNEARAKSGLLRGREFRMKDLYSFHRDEEDLKKYYEEAKKVYAAVYEELGVGDDTFITLSGGGDFTKDFSHEFQTLSDAGEDIIYLDRKNKIAYNKEVVTEENAQRLGVDFKTLEQVKASEVGNIFPLGTKFSKALDFTFKDEEGKEQPIFMGCYGIGPSRLMGILAEKFSDEKGLIWPENVAPFLVHILSFGQNDMASKLYEKMKAEGIEVLLDDRDTGVGSKLADSDLFGIPYRVIVSEKSLAAGGYEVKKRKESDPHIINEEALISILKNK
jgi:prolyl-tRNA synthetase